ncbi:hypothetical protein P4T04_15570 [Bacillus badius]|uniref:hypothetical protein n=1 Tax=Bacillus badius TaxID=1455 RepID=UPI002E1EA005|nr:hypothetical protein [Bacillus badius]
MENTKWIKNGRIYTLEDTEGNVLFTVEDRTCGGSYVTDSILEEVAADYFKELEGSREDGNGITSY